MPVYHKKESKSSSFIQQNTESQAEDEEPWKLSNFSWGPLIGLRVLDPEQKGNEEIETLSEKREEMETFTEMQMDVNCQDKEDRCRERGGDAVTPVVEVIHVDSDPEEGIPDIETMQVDGGITGANVMEVDGGDPGANVMENPGVPGRSEEGESSSSSVPVRVRVSYLFSGLPFWPNPYFQNLRTRIAPPSILQKRPHPPLNSDRSSFKRKKDKNLTITYEQCNRQPQLSKDELQTYLEKTAQAWEPLPTDPNIGAFELPKVGNYFLAVSYSF